MGMITDLKDVTPNSCYPALALSIFNSLPAWGLTCTSQYVHKSSQPYVIRGRLSLFPICWELCVFLCDNRESLSISRQNCGGDDLENQTPACPRVAGTKKQQALSSCDRDLLPGRGRSEIDAKPLGIVSLCSRWAGRVQIESAPSGSQSPHNELLSGRGQVVKAAFL